MDKHRVGHLSFILNPTVRIEDQQPLLLLRALFVRSRPLISQNDVHQSIRLEGEVHQVGLLKSLNVSQTQHSNATPSWIDDEERGRSRVSVKSDSNRSISRATGRKLTRQLDPVCNVGRNFLPSE